MQLMQWWGNMAASWRRTGRPRGQRADTAARAACRQLSALPPLVEPPGAAPPGCPRAAWHSSTDTGTSDQPGCTEAQTGCALAVQDEWSDGVKHVRAASWYRCYHFKCTSWRTFGMMPVQISHSTTPSA
jgi:hypothetical protein